MSEHSIFYKAATECRFAIPLIAYEEIEVGLQNMEEETTEEALFSMYSFVMVKWCKVEKPTNENLQYFTTTVSKVMQEAAEAVKEQESAEAKPTKRGFASNFYKALSKLDMASMLINATGFDYKKAEYLYCEVDRLVALGVIRLYMDRLQHDHSIMLESAVYGFGGDMGEGNSNDTIETEIDLVSGKGASNMFKAMNKKI